MALNTQPLVELLYGTFNPDEAETQKLDEVENLQGAVVERQPPQPDEFAIPEAAPAPADAEAQPQPASSEDVQVIPPEQTIKIDSQPAPTPPSNVPLSAPTQPESVPPKAQAEVGPLITADEVKGQ